MMMSDWLFLMQVDSPDWPADLVMDSTDFDEIPAISLRRFATYLDLMLFVRVLVQF